MQRTSGRRTVALVVGGVIVALLPMSPAPAQSPPAPPGASAPPKADVDSNKLFDDLEADLEGKPDDARVRVIVTLREAATEDRVRGLERRLGRLDVGRRFGIVPAFSATVSKRLAKVLARQSDVAQVEADSIVYATNDTAQSSFGVTAARAAVPGLDGSGVKVAVIDTGVATSHVDLAGKVVAFRDYIGGRTTSYDDHGHGTHVAATIAGSGAGNPRHAGAAPAASLIVAKVLNSVGDGSISDVTAAIDWAVTEGAQVINLSLGSDGCADGTDATSQAVNNAAARGVFVAVAAGNSGPGTCTVGSPGAATGATTVGAMADLDHGGFHLAGFSSRGKLGGAGSDLKPDVAAPGVGIVSANAFTANGYTAMNGTSMATPFVAAVGALMLDKGIAPANLKPTVQSTAADWGAAGDDIEFGFGRLDAYRAITATVDPTVRPVHSFRQSSLAGTGATTDYPIPVSDTRFPVSAMLVHPDVSAGFAATPDFDLYLLGPSGTELARGYTNSRQETVAATPSVTGTYTLRVRSYIGSGTFQVDWSAGTGGAPPPPRTTSTTTTSTTTTSTTTTRPPTSTTSSTVPSGPSCGGRRATIVGTPGNDRLTGTAGPDVIVGLGGADSIYGLDGNDVICGGAGNDVVDGGAGNDIIEGEAGKDRAIGGVGDDDVRGGGEADSLFGNNGNDVVNGGPAVDTCNGGAGTNTFVACE
ncbi:MAG: S8 family serine peptidase [Acidimicrobiia bacterium]|nr:S8 family serine peptidase [Acidimicrobiia bacterium]